MTEKITQALAKLDVGNDEHWTVDGQPKIEALRLVSGDFLLKRDDVTKAAPNFSRTNPSLNPVDQGVVKPIPIVPQENENATSDAVQGSPGNSASKSESELEGQDETDLEAQLDRARARLDKATSAKHQADQECREAASEVDRLIEAGAKSAQNDSFSDAMKRHLAQQQRIREQRGEQIARVRASGVNLKDLVPQRPPIESAIASSVIQARKQRAASGG